MTEFFSLNNILILAAAGLVLFIGIFALRGVIKIALKILRIVLILFAIAVIVGALFGYLDISLI
ncbi:hypothetical protein JR338_11215 [Chloroflexota bacterium]|nr:hypothetical protein JR338_11215 [Chloroflexota bacterium]